MESVTDCVELYKPGIGVADGAVVSMVYSDVEMFPELPAVSFAKYFSVVVVLMEIGVE